LISYAPWKVFRAPDGKKGIKQPYEPLLRIARQLEFDDRFRLMADGEECILKWCADYGLLGLLLHRIETVILPAEQKTLMIGGASVIRGPFHRKYERTNSGWSTSGVLALPSVAPAGVFLRSDLGSFDLTFEKLSRTWGTYFPDVPPEQRDIYQYPIPFTGDFWREYAEPVVNFFGAARKFYEAVETLTKLRTRQRLSGDQWREGVAALEVINRLAVPVRPMLYRGTKRFEMGWACHSLLAAFAMMVIQDLAGSRLLECANPSCQSFFVSKAREAKYCSPTCRGTVQMRKYRQRRLDAHKGSRK
jgi:hypothetical protein